MKRNYCFASLLTMVAFAQFAQAVSPTPDEMALSRQWAAAKFEGGKESKDAEPFFSFTYDGKPSAELLQTWELKRASQKTRRQSDANTRSPTPIRRPSWRSAASASSTATSPPSNGRSISKTRATKTRRSSPTSRPWTKASSAKPTPNLPCIPSSAITCSPGSYQPYTETLGPKAVEANRAGRRPAHQRLVALLELRVRRQRRDRSVWAGPASGRPDSIAMKPKRSASAPARNSRISSCCPAKKCARRWWCCNFTRAIGSAAKIFGGGWMLAHNLPRPGGKQITPHSAGCYGNSYPGIITNAAEELHFLRRYVEEKIVPDFWWQDAGWYPCGDPGNWGITGTWEVEPKRWPKGIREVSDWCREQGIKTLVWFEPERVASGHLARREPSRMDFRRQKRRPAEPGRCEVPRVAHRSYRQAHERPGDRYLPPGFQHRSAGLLARRRCRRPARHRRE